MAEKKKRILIVDDQKVNRQILQRILSDSYETVEAEDGRRAIHILEHDKRISAVLLDVIMPEMNGYDVLHILQSKGMLNIPVIVVTGEDKEESEQKALDAGAWDYVTKPYRAKVILSRLQNAIARSELDVLEQMQYLSDYDQLTKVYKRNKFYREVRKMIQNSPEQRYAIVRFDVNRFTLINSVFGVKEGDRLLVFLSNILRELASRRSDFVYGRLEGDEFAFCCACTGQIEVENLVAEVIRSSRKFDLAFDVVLACGIYLVQSTQMSISDMLDCAKMAAKTIKGNYINNYAFYKSEMSNQLRIEQKIVNNMNKALAQEEFEVYLQPKYNLQNNLPAGAEALVRWNSQDEGMISPGSFIPVFEKNGFIIKLDHYMWEKVCQLIHRWLECGMNVLPISVNVSRISMYDPKIVSVLKNLVEKYNIPVELMNLEVTESAYMSAPELMMDVITQLREYGFIILMDDFGSGYSSLNTLKDIEVDVLKVDMKFLPTGRNNVKSEKILTSITRMAGWLGMDVVVEGVETQQQLSFLNSIGCGYVQGFYFARPMPVPDFENLVRNMEQSVALMREGSEDLQEIDLLWSSEGEISYILKGIAVPFVIYEYANYACDMIRVNDAFIREFDYDAMRSQGEDKFLSHMESLKLLSAFEDAVQKKGTSECDCQFVYENGEVKWFQIRLQYIRTISKRHILCATFSEITTEKRMEGVVQKIYNLLNQGQKIKRGMLVIDDSEISRDLLRAMFQDEFQVFSAHNGVRGLQLLREQANNICIIMLDLLMPEMGGVEFLQCKNQIPEIAAIPVIVVSSESQEDLQIQMLKNGVNDYVTKPFVPEVVHRRVKNVLEYNSRFQTLLQEYQDTNIDVLAPREGTDDSYSPAEANQLMSYLRDVFDVVRLVQPEETKVISITTAGEIQKAEYSCYKVWNKDRRCENCSSMCAQNRSCQMTKYEFMNEDIFYVVSKPIHIQLQEQEVLTCVLEIASHVSNHLLMDYAGDKTVREILEETQMKIYTDDLTKAYNRRYWNEMRFLYRGQNAVADKVGIIMMDLTHFKQTNDTYGHLVGDQILQRVAQKLQQSIQKHDSVIRYGGDEFLIALTRRNEQQVQAEMEYLRSAVSQVFFGQKQSEHVSAAFGYAYTEHFMPEEEFLGQMLKTADEMMYAEKNQQGISR